MTNSKTILLALLCLVSISLTYGQDLVPTNVTISNSYSGLPNTSIPQGGEFTIRVDVENIASSGNAAASKVRYYVSTKSFYDNTATYLGMDHVGSLAPGTGDDEALYPTMPSNLAPNANGYYILVRVDADNDVTESNENNNVSATAISIVAGAPDLFLYNLNANGITAAGANAEFTFRIGNQGNVTAGASNVKAYISSDKQIGQDDYIGQVSLSPVANGVGSNVLATVSGTIPLNMQGSKYIIFIVDENNNIAELNENNNVGIMSVTVSAPTPDLQVSNVSADKTNVRPGTSIYVQGNLSNEGSANVAAANVRFYLSGNATYDNSDLPLQVFTVNNLAPNSSQSFGQNVFIPLNVIENTYRILVRVDYDEAVTELDEDNNVAATASVSVYDVDLRVLSPSIVANSSFEGNVAAVEGEAVFLSYTMLNAAGNGPSPNYKMAFWLSENTTLEAGTDTKLNEVVYNLVRGEVKDIVDYPVNLPNEIDDQSGYWHIIFSIDEDDDIDESNEANNTFVVPLYIYNTNNRPGPGGGGTPPCCIIPPGGGGGSGPAQRVALQADAPFELSTYPNPAQGSTTVSLGAVGNYNVQLVDAQGRQVLQRQVQGANSTSLDLAGLQKGIYLLKAQGAAGVKIQRLVVQ